MTDTPRLVADLDEIHRAARDPAKAPAMARYMRDQFVFLGIANPARKKLDTTLRREAAADPDALPAIARWCFAQEPREFQYFACDALRAAAPRRLGPGHLPLARELITCRSWWDTVDTLATNVVGTLVRRFPELAGEMDRSIQDANMWLRRSGILHQLKYGADTDGSRLFDYVERTLADRDFFIRKAIGWALRQFAKTDPDRVRDFVSAHRHSMSSLSVREATKYMP